MVDKVNLVVWGPSSKLLAGDEELQAYIEEMQDNGIEINACKWCADTYGVSEKLESLGINVVYMGKPFTDMIKEGWTTITICF